MEVRVPRFCKFLEKIGRGAVVGGAVWLHCGCLLVPPVVGWLWCGWLVPAHRYGGGGVVVVVLLAASSCCWVVVGWLVSAHVISVLCACSGVAIHCMYVYTYAPPAVL
jgi:hypothetical protein